MSVPPLPEIFGNYALGDFVELVPPGPIGWLPQTAGWLWLGLALLALGGYYGWKRLRRWYANRYRREAVARVHKISEDPEPAAIVARLNCLLKLTALAAYPREEVASLSGRAWVDFLCRVCPNPVFEEQHLALLATGSYRSPEIDRATAQSLLDASRRWIAGHRGRDDA